MNKWNIKSKMAYTYFRYTICERSSTAFLRKVMKQGESINLRKAAYQVVLERHHARTA